MSLFGTFKLVLAGHLLFVGAFNCIPMTMNERARERDTCESQKRIRAPKMECASNGSHRVEHKIVNRRVINCDQMISSSVSDQSSSV